MSGWSSQRAVIRLPIISKINYLSNILYLSPGDLHSELLSEALLVLFLSFRLGLRLLVLKLLLHVWYEDRCSNRDFLLRYFLIGQEAARIRHQLLPVVLLLTQIV